MLKSLEKCIIMWYNYSEKLFCIKSSAALQMQTDTDKQDKDMSKIKSVLDYISRVREKGKAMNKSGLYIAFAFISVYALIMSLVCFVKADTIMGIVNLLITVAMIAVIIIFSKIKSERTLAVCVVALVYALMVFFLFQGGVGGVSIMWLLFVPMAGMAFINLYYGGLLSLMLGVTVPIYMFTPLNNLGYQYSEDYRIRFPIIYWAFLIIAFVIFVRIDKVDEELEELVRRADASNRSKSEFLANMSHELRTPMNAIMGMCELTMKEDISDAVRENNENIYHSSKNLINTINDLLDFSKIESGRMELSCSQYRLSDVLNDVIYMTTARKGTKNISFAVVCDPDIPDLLYGDEMRIKQVMINLLTNAIKYTNEGGFALSLTYRRESYGINLIISVKDSGIGIKKEHVDKIFDVYGRVDSEKTHRIEGTGLGLPITKEIIQLMHGVITVRSTYGKGSEFKVVIPQRVVDETPIVSFDDTEELGLLCYHSSETIPQFAAQALMDTFKTVVKKFNIPYSWCKNLDELKQKISIGRFSCVLLGKKEYLEDKDYFDSLSDTLSVAVVQEKTDQTSVGGNIMNIYMPFYTRKLSDAINKQAHEKKKKIPEAFSAPDAKVLVVDDNEMNLKVAAGLMKLHGIVIDTASNGIQAIEMTRKKKYDLVFMDHLMPDMDGIEAHREIRFMEKDCAEKTPIIALTANIGGEVREMFASEGFQDFISKPIQPELLRKILVERLPANLIVVKKEQTNE